jgi:hypothetical protein
MWLATAVFPQFRRSERLSDSDRSIGRHSRAEPSTPIQDRPLEAAIPPFKRKAEIQNCHRGPRDAFGQVRGYWRDKTKRNLK